MSPVPEPRFDKRPFLRPPLCPSFKASIWVAVAGYTSQRTGLSIGVGRCSVTRLFCLLLCAKPAFRLSFIIFGTHPCMIDLLSLPIDIPLDFPNAALILSGFRLLIVFFPPQSCILLARLPLQAKEGFLIFHIGRGAVIPGAYPSFTRVALNSSSFDQICQEATVLIPVFLVQLQPDLFSFQTILRIMEASFP